MLDKSLTYCPLAMTKTDTKNYPRFELPEGYTFRFYRAGDEKDWAAIECLIGQFDTEAAALRMFRGEFIENQRLKPEERMLFVIDPEGNAVATASLWDGDFLGEIKPRFHWVAVTDACTGKGIAKAMLCRIMDLYNELSYEGFLYLHTSTWSYQAIGIYKKLGFVPYLEEKNPFSYISDEAYEKNNAAGWAAVENKHALYRK
jgi:GNAT superfamily N-acetyltransferase